MTTFQHSMNLFQRPRQGNAFLGRYEIYNYRHTITAKGGDDTASCSVRVKTMEEGQRFLDQNLGGRVAFYANDPAQPIWEGYINRLTFNAGAVSYTISLDELANQVVVIYTLLGATAPTTPAGASNTPSITTYGLKRQSFDIGFHRTVGTGVSNMINTLLNQRSWPKSSITEGNGENGVVTLECLGFQHALKWDTQRQTGAGGLVALNTYFTSQLMPAYNTQCGATIIDATVTRLISANALTADVTKIREQSFHDLFMELSEYGDGTNYWVWGITPTQSNNARYIYYRAANFNTVYTARSADGLRVRNAYGKLEHPWNVKPDCIIKVSDDLIGWDGLGDDPTTTYIQRVEYDANTLRVNWYGDDDTSAEGAYQFGIYGKPMNKRFGAPRRLV